MYKCKNCGLTDKESLYYFETKEVIRDKKKIKQTTCPECESTHVIKKESPKFKKRKLFY